MLLLAPRRLVKKGEEAGLGEEAGIANGVVAVGVMGEHTGPGDALEVSERVGEIKL